MSMFSKEFNSSNFIFFSHLDQSAVKIFFEHSLTRSFYKSNSRKEKHSDNTNAARKDLPVRDERYEKPFHCASPLLDLKRVPFDSTFRNFHFDLGVSLSQVALIWHYSLDEVRGRGGKKRTNTDWSESLAEFVFDAQSDPLNFETPTNITMLGQERMCSPRRPDKLRVLCWAQSNFGKGCTVELEAL